MGRAGDGFESVDEWRAAHEVVWHSDEFRDSIGDPGFHVTDESEIVCVRMTIQVL